MNKLKLLITAALMAALTCVTTMVISIPLPYGGYIHPGDGFVLLSGFILGPIYGPFAAGIGSMLADLLLGYSQYALATFIIKGLAAFVAAFVYRFLRRKSVVLGSIAAGVLAGIIVTVGYFVFESFLMGAGAAIANSPLNLVQNVAGILISTLLLPILVKIPQIKDIMKSVYGQTTNQSN